MPLAAPADAAADGDGPGSALGCHTATCDGGDAPACAFASGSASSSDTPSGAYTSGTAAGGGDGAR